MADFGDHLRALRERYGELMLLNEVAEVLKYKSTVAVRKAHSRGTLPVKLYKIPGKSGLCAKTVQVATFIENIPLSQSVTSCPSEGGANM